MCFVFFLRIRLRAVEGWALRGGRLVVIRFRFLLDTTPTFFGDCIDGFCPLPGKEKWRKPKAAPSEILYLFPE